MTNNQLTKEWLQNRIADMESTRDDIPFGFDESGNNELAAFKLALAAMDSESECLPLDYLQGHKDGLEWAAQLAEANHPETGDWLYDDPIELAKAIRKGPDMPPSQPVPVVLDDYQRLSELYHAQEKRLFKIARRIKGPAFDKYSHSPSQAIDVLEVAIFGEDDAFRAAMLQAGNSPVIPDEMTSEQAYEIDDYHGDPVDVFARGANWMRQHIIDSTLAAAPQSPGSEPATVRGKWIPVSERMPEDRTQVILWDAEIGEVTSGHYSHKTQTFYHCGDAIENEITHWMPTPAAPQEVKP